MTNASTTGYIHSIESLGAVDGPGLRTVVFISGCNVGCTFCHNKDVTVAKAGQKYEAAELVEKIAKNKSYFDASGGGVTFSGGDPFFQAGFLTKCLELLNKKSIHTTVDTSLFTSREKLEKVIPYTDLLMISIKHMDDAVHQKITRISNVSIFENLRFLATQETPIRIRFVIMPGITDTDEHLEKFRDFMREIKPAEIELLPYHDHGIVKWKELGLKYELEDLTIPSDDKMKQVAQYLSEFEIICN